MYGVRTIFKALVVDTKMKSIVLVFTGLKCKCVCIWDWWTGNRRNGVGNKRRTSQSMYTSNQRRNLIPSSNESEDKSICSGWKYCPNVISFRRKQWAQNNGKFWENSRWYNPCRMDVGSSRRPSLNILPTPLSLVNRPPVLPLAPVLTWYLHLTILKSNFTLPLTCPLL